MHPHIQHLLHCIDLEEKEQLQRFRLDQQHSLRQLKAEGLALHPIIVTKKTLDMPITRRSHLNYHFLRNSVCSGMVQR